MAKDSIIKNENLSSSRILIVEDELKLLSHLAQIMRDEGHYPFTCQSYRELENLLRLPIKRFDVVILNRILHGLDSAELIEKIKAELPDAKILILSATSSPSVKTALLDKGADDYMAKPFGSEKTGNGLGLAWVLTVAKLYQWSFELNTQPIGTMATIRFPKEDTT